MSIKDVSIVITTILVVATLFAVGLNYVAPGQTLDGWVRMEGGIQKIVLSDGAVCYRSDTNHSSTRCSK